MINKENGLLEIYERIKADRILLGIKTFKRTPTSPVELPDLPCVFMLEDIDNIVKSSSRRHFGYPCQRAAEIPIELIVSKSVDIKTLFLNLRKTIFRDRSSTVIEPIYNAIIANNVFIQENRTEGPTGYGLPDIKAMRLVLDLVYTDDGF